MLYVALPGFSTSLSISAILFILILSTADKSSKKSLIIFGTLHLYFRFTLVSIVGVHLGTN